MVGSLLLRGMLVGVVAGLVAFAFARTFGEPSLDLAIAFEEAADAEPGGGHHHGAGSSQSHDESAGPSDEHGDQLFSRSTQSGIGLATGLVIYGAAVGGIFSLVFAFAYGRVGPLGARATSALLAFAAFLAVVVVPQIKYPANPPAIGSGDTIGPRTALFFVMLAVSVGAMTAAVVVARRLWAAHGSWNAILIATAAYLVFIAAVQFSLPPTVEAPNGFPADVLWQFRVASLGMHAVLWTVIGLGFGVLAERRFGEGRNGRLAALRR